MFYRVVDLRLTPQLLDHDHYPIFMKIHIMKRLDYSIINNPQNRINFCEEVLNNIPDRTDLTYTNLAESITKATTA